MKNFNGRQIENNVIRILAAISTKLIVDKVINFKDRRRDKKRKAYLEPVGNLIVDTFDKNNHYQNIKEVEEKNNSISIMTMLDMMELEK